MLFQSYGKASNKSGRKRWGVTADSVDDWDDFDLSMSFSKKPAPQIQQPVKHQTVQQPLINSNLSNKPAAPSPPKPVMPAALEDDDEFFAYVLCH